MDFPNLDKTIYKHFAGYKKGNEETEIAAGSVCEGGSSFCNIHS